jgi:hypothetical protein
MLGLRKIDLTCLTTYKNMRFQQTSLKAAANYPVTTNQVSVVASLAPAVNKSLATIRIVCGVCQNIAQLPTLSLI